MRIVNVLYTVPPVQLTLSNTVRANHPLCVNPIVLWSLGTYPLESGDIPTTVTVHESIGRLLTKATNQYRQQILVYCNRLPTKEKLLPPIAYSGRLRQETSDRVKPN